MEPKLLDQWVCVGTSVGLLPQQVQRVLAEGHDIAVWRGNDGRVRAWQNRCPHRGMRLSFGFVRDNRLTCLYHGWTYNGEGACVSIPAHPQLTPPKTITTTAYQCAENAGLIWVASAGIEALPIIDGGWCGARSLRVDASTSAITTTLRNLSCLDAASDPRSIAVREISGPVSHTFQISGAVPGLSLICGIQSASAEMSMVHVSVPERGSSDLVSRRAASDWAKSLRREVETLRKAALAA